MVTIYGLNEKVGNLTYYDSQNQDPNFTKPYSEKTSELIDKEISNLIEVEYKRAIKILTKNIDKLHQLAAILLDKEVIFKDDMEAIFGKRPFIKPKMSERVGKTAAKEQNSNAKDEVNSEKEQTPDIKDKVNAENTTDSNTSKVETEKE
jgi:cell division protease FtsH